MVLSDSAFSVQHCYIAAKTTSMKKTALRFGLYGVYTILALCLISWLLKESDPENYEVREILGWAGIVLSVSFVFWGLKYYRDKENGGRLGFGEGLKLGLLIVLFPAFLFGIYNVLYVMVLDPGFLDEYYNYKVSQLNSNLSAPELQDRIKEIKDTKQMFTNPLVQFIVMFLSVFFIGLIVTVISTLILKRKAAVPA